MENTPVVLDRRAFGAPSWAGRVVISLLLAVGFYVFTLVVVALLLATPVFFLVEGGLTIRGLILAFLFCWIPAVLLAQGVLHVRPPRFSPPGRSVSREQAPDLFDFLSDLSRRTGTRAPDQVYLAAQPRLSVTETGGTFGFGSRRILVIGVPILETLRVDELRAGLAHEYGHFAFGDTRLLGLLSYLEAAFRSVLSSVERSPFRRGTNHLAIEGAFELASFLGDSIVAGWGRVYLRSTQAASRLQELAADRLAATIAGKEAAQRALEAVHLLGVLYARYLTVDVARAAKAGAFPVDLAEGFRACRARFDANGVTQACLETLLAEKGDPFDSHPPLAVRVQSLSAFSSDADAQDARPALDLFNDKENVRAWALDATRAMLPDAGALTTMSWEEMPERAFGAKQLDEATEIAAVLHASFPRATTLRAMFAAVVGAFEDGHALEIAPVLDGRINHLDPHTRAIRAHAIATSALGKLFQGALLEAGGRVETSLGESSLLIRIGDESVPAATLAEQAMQSEEAKQAMSRWAKRFSAPQRVFA